MSNPLQTEADKQGFKTVNPREVEGHVYEVWGDCEVALTKSGDLYGQRNLHQQLPPLRPGDIREPVAFESRDEAFRFAKYLWERWKEYGDTLIDVYAK